MTMQNLFSRVALALLGATLYAAAAIAQIAGTATSQVQVTPNASAYVSGYCLGGVLVVPNMIRPSGPGGTILIGMSITDPTGNDAAIDFLVFNQAPIGTYTDHSNCVVAAADQPFLQGLISDSIFTCALDEATATGICNGTPALPMTSAAFPVVSPNLWVVPIIRGTPTYGAGKTLYFNFKAIAD